MNLKNKVLAVTGLAFLISLGTAYADKQSKPDKKQLKRDIQHFIQLKNTQAA